MVDKHLEKRLIYFVSVFCVTGRFSRTNFCFETLLESCTGTIASSYYSQVNLIGNASFEDNQAATNGGKEKFEDGILPIQGE